MNSKQIFSIILEFEKNMAKNYATGITECSSDDLTNELLEQYTDIMQNQRDIFNYMYAQEWYKLDFATNTKIEKEYNKNLKIFEKLNCN